MIAVTRLNGAKFFLNAELIQMIEEFPDTHITLVNEKKVVVRESASVVAERIIEYQRRKRQAFITQDETIEPGT